MGAYDRLRGLELVIDDVRTERRSVDVSSDFKRVTTVVVLSGRGVEGRGEDVTYTAGDHDWFPSLDPPGATTLGELSSSLDGLTLFDGEPEMPASRDYRRWAFESAALDLALRQAGASLAEAVDAARPEGFTFAIAEELYPCARRLGALLRSAPLDDFAVALLELLERVVPLPAPESRPALVEPLTEREVVVLRFYRDLTQQDIADRLGLSQAQVSRTLSTAFAKLRSALVEP